MISRLLGAFLEERAGGWSAETQEKYGRNLRDLGAWLGARRVTDPAQITPGELREWLDAHTHWSAATRHVAVSSMRAFFGWAVGREKSPAHKVPLPHRVIRPQRTLTAAQAGELLSSIDSFRPKGTRDLAIVALLLDTGLRSSEICRLELAHVDLERRSLQVLAKGRRWERGVFSDYTRQVLERWLILRPQFARTGEGALFVSLGGLTPGRKLTRYGLQIILRKLGVDAGIGPISPHDFRRTFATLALRAGAPTRIVQVAGRWRSLSMVERYSQAITAEDLDGHFPVAAIMGLGEQQ